MIILSLAQNKLAIVIFISLTYYTRNKKYCIMINDVVLAL